MATAPVKPQPQPLHNFPLSLKWGQTTPVAAATAATAGSTNPNRSSSSRSPVPDSETESDTEPLTRPTVLPPPRVGSRSARVHRMSFASCSTILPKAGKASPEKQASGVVAESNGKSWQRQAAVLDGNNDGAHSEGEEEKRRKEEEERNSRPWKLRPRKGNLKEAAAAATLQGNEHTEREHNGYQVQPKSTRLRGSAENNGGGGVGGGEAAEKKEKRKFWIALSREEIEEDIFVMTGSRPARRPKKRPRNVQKVLDNVFPGLWLVGTTADYYRLAENPVKK